MKIADALLLQKDIAEEIARLRQLARESGWEFRSISREHPDAKDIPTFDLEENHRRVKRLSKLHRQLSRAISRANNHIDLPNIDDSEYADWL